MLAYMRKKQYLCTADINKLSTSLPHLGKGGCSLLFIRKHFCVFSAVRPLQPRRGCKPLGVVSFCACPVRGKKAT